jgi:hypothetical protein
MCARQQEAHLKNTLFATSAQSTPLCRICLSDFCPNSIIVYAYIFQMAIFFVFCIENLHLFLHAYASFLPPL